MSNQLNRNPIIIDTFNADFQISIHPITVKKVVLYSAAAADKLSLKHGKDDTTLECIRVVQDSSLQKEVDFKERGHIFPDGLFFDASDQSGLDNGSDRVLIYLK